VSENCNLCNGELQVVNIEGGVCTVCLAIHGPNRTPKSWGPKSSGRDIDAQYIIQINSDIIKEGYACTYCEDVFSIDDMNDIIGRWLCSQCYTDHVLQQ